MATTSPNEITESVFDESEWNSSAASILSFLQEQSSYDSPPRGVETHTQEVAERINRSFHTPIGVRCIAPGVYSVPNIDGENYIVSIDSIIDGDERGVCSCGDFHYRCRGMDIDCKHIIAVKKRLRRGLLPPRNSEPIKWVRNRVPLLRFVLLEHKPDSCVLSGTKVDRYLDLLYEDPHHISFEYVVWLVLDFCEVNG